MDHNKSRRIELLVTPEQDSKTITADLTQRGWLVTTLICPQSIADWVGVPIIRMSSGCAYYGRDGLRAFMEREEKT